MRVLLTHHTPLADSTSGRHACNLRTALTAAGHSVHCVVSAREAEETSGTECRQLTCSPSSNGADLPFDVPVFGNERLYSRTFGSLSDRELAQYRDGFRKILDAEVECFDPHLIHAQHVWLHGQLALETGVPYVLTAWGPELDELSAGEQFRSMAEQAAENAGCIFCHSPDVLERVRSEFGIPSERLALLGPDCLNGEAGSGLSPDYRGELGTIIEQYQRVLDERFGRSPA